MTSSALIHLTKRLLDSNEAPWTLPLPPWYPARHRRLRRLRQLARRKLRTELITRQGWCFTLCQLMAWPLIAVSKSVRAVRFYDATWPSRFRQIVAYTRLQLAHNLRVADQEDHWLTRPEWRKDVTGYITCREHQALMSLCTPAKGSHGYPEIFTKLSFDAFCIQHDLPSAPRLAWGQGGQCEGLSPLPADDLVLKPSAMGRGKGVEILRYDPPTRRWRGVGARLISEQDLATYAHEQLGDNPWLIQPRLRNADAWLPFTPGALATARIITGRTNANAAPMLIGGYLRMPRTGAVADNLCLGGIGALLDLTSHRMGAGHTYQDCFDEFQFHPDTGGRIAGVELPGFSDLAALVLRAHAAAGSWASIGWDVALSRNGPVLIEANLHWAIIPGMPITRTSYLEVTESGLIRAERLRAVV